MVPYSSSDEDDRRRRRSRSRSSHKHRPTKKERRHRSKSRGSRRRRSSRSRSRSASSREASRSRHFHRVRRRSRSRSNSPATAALSIKITSTSRKLGATAERTLDSPEQNLKIEFKPLILPADSEAERAVAIGYIEGSSFVQEAFKSGRHPSKMTKAGADGTPTSTGVTSDGGLYAAMMLERSHEAAIFGKSSTAASLLVTATQPGSAAALGTHPSEAREKLTSTVDVTSDLVSDKLKKDPNVAWKRWLDRLRQLQLRSQRDLDTAAANTAT